MNNFLTELLESARLYRLKYPTLRKGQSFMCVLSMLDKKKYDEITNTDADCFYDDKKIENFISSFNADEVDSNTKNLSTDIEKTEHHSNIFCWVCGTKLNHFDIGFYKCSKCDSTFFLTITNKVQSLDLINQF